MRLAVALIVIGRAVQWLCRLTEIAILGFIEKQIKTHTHTHRFRAVYKTVVIKRHVDIKISSFRFYILKKVRHIQGSFHKVYVSRKIPI
jgi:hypothetical protein